MLNFSAANFPNFSGSSVQLFEGSWVPDSTNFLADIFTSTATDQNGDEFVARFLPTGDILGLLNVPLSAPTQSKLTVLFDPVPGTVITYKDAFVVKGTFPAVPKIEDFAQTSYTDPNQMYADHQAFGNALSDWRTSFSSFSVTELNYDDDNGLRMDITVGSPVNLQDLLAFTSEDYFSGETTIAGSEQNDILIGENSNAGQAATTIFAGGGSDRLFGTAGNDIFNGGNGVDYLIGGSGNDLLNGDGDNDVIYGIHVHDRNTGWGNNTVDGGGGTDTLVYDVNEAALELEAVSWSKLAGIGGSQNTNLVISYSGVGASAKDTITSVERFLFAGAETNLANLQAIASIQWTISQAQKLIGLLTPLAPGQALILNSALEALKLPFEVGLNSDPKRGAFIEIVGSAVELLDDAAEFVPEPFRTVAKSVADDLETFVRLGADRLYDRYLADKSKYIDLSGNPTGDLRTELSDVYSTAFGEMSAAKTPANPLTEQQTSFQHTFQFDSHSPFPNNNDDDQQYVPEPNSVPIGGEFGAGNDKYLGETIDASGFIRGRDGNDQLKGGDRPDWFWGEKGTDLLKGNGGTDFLDGGEGDDTLDGGPGADTMNGGMGNDVYVVEDTADIVNENANEGDDIVDTTVTFNVPLNVEVLRMQGTGNIDATGTAARDIIVGNSGNNIINGAGGFDVMQGGAGNDTYAVDNSYDAVIEASGEGYDNVYSSIDYIIPETSEIESALLTGNAVVLRGSNFDNQLIGNDQVNVIDGRGGTDYMLGGGGDDIFQITPENGAVDVIGDFTNGPPGSGDRIAFAGFNAGTATVTQVSAVSFLVRDTLGTASSSDDIEQQFQLFDFYGAPGYTGGPLVEGDDYYFG